MTENKICPVCGENSLHEVSDYEYFFKHGRKNHAVRGLLRSVCGECEVSLFLPEQLNNNKEKIDLFQANLKDFIGARQILQLREKYNITQSQANIIFGGGPTAFSKYERGITSPTAGTARQMLVALRDPDFMAALANVQNIKIHDIRTKAQPEKLDSTKNFVDSIPQNIRGFIQQYAGQVRLPIHETCLALLSKGIDVVKTSSSAHWGIIFDYKEVKAHVQSESVRQTRTKMQEPRVIRWGASR